MTRARQASAEELDIHGDISSADKEYFSVFLCGSVLANACALLERLVHEIDVEAAGMLGRAVTLPEKPMPYINKYVSFLEKDCGLKVQVKSEVWKSLDRVRALRNKFIYEFIREPNGKREGVELAPVVLSALEPASVLESFVIVGEFAARLESAYWNCFEKNIR